MPTTKQTKRLVLGSDDAAFVVRGSGELELLLPNNSDDELVPSDQFALIAFADAFYDDRVRDLLRLIWDETEHGTEPH